jgi:hypothetical protein
MILDSDWESAGFAIGHVHVVTEIVGLIHSTVTMNVHIIFCSYELDVILVQFSSSFSLVLVDSFSGTNIHREIHPWRLLMAA